MACFVTRRVCFVKMAEEEPSHVMFYAYICYLKYGLIPMNQQSHKNHKI